MGRLDFAAGDVVANKYRVVRLLGRGGMGAVYVARSVTSGQEVALKLVEVPDDAPAVAARFERETTATQGIKHPGIGRVLGRGALASGVAWLAMEYFEGQLLETLISNHRRLEPAVAVTIAAEMLDALAAAHAAEVLHRDLKPANVILANKPRRAVVLLDFGISKLMNDSHQLTVTGDLLGTPGYMAPEQALGETGVTTATDLYAVGVMLFELLTGKLPISQRAAYQGLGRVVDREAVPLESERPGLDPRLYALVDSLLEVNPRARPQSAVSVRRQLLEIQPAEPERLWAWVDTSVADAMHTLPEKPKDPPPTHDSVRIVPPAPPPQEPRRRRTLKPGPFGTFGPIFSAVGLITLFGLGVLGAAMFLSERTPVRRSPVEVLREADQAIEAGDYDRGEQLLSVAATDPNLNAEVSRRRQSIFWLRLAKKHGPGALDSGAPGP